MNVQGLLAKRSKGKEDVGSSSGRHPPSALRESARPLPRSHSKGVNLPDSINRGSGSRATPPPKRTKLASSEPVHHGKGKPLCPHFSVIDASKDLWCHPELGPAVMRHNIQEADMAYLRPLSSDELMNSIFSKVAWIPAVIQTLCDRAIGYEEMQAKAEKYEEKFHSLTRELAQLKLDRDSSRKQLEKQLSEVREELKAEVTSGHKFFESLGGQRFLKLHYDKVISKYEKSERSRPFRERVIFEYKESKESEPFRERVISKFKKSTEFTDAVEEASIPIFDECLAFCRERLINSGRFPGKKFEFLDPDWVEMIEEDSTIGLASQGTSFLPTAPKDDGMGLRGKGVE